MKRRIVRASALIGAAIVGVLGAHELDYRLLVPDPMHRHDLLLRTGHGYLSRALFIVLAVGLVATIASIALGAARARDGARAPSIGGTAAMLAAVQSGAFVMLEAVERLIVGAPPGDRFLLVTFVGIGVQVLTALAAAVVLVLLERTAHAVASALVARPPVLSVKPVRWSVHPSVSPRPAVLGTVGARAPPLFV